MAAAGLASYVAVLRVPGAFAFGASATPVRPAQAVLGLGSVLLQVLLGRSDAVAGLLAGAVSVAQGVVGPQVSPLVDVHGQRAVVLPQVLAHAAAMSGPVAAGLAGAPTWLLVDAALIAGARRTPRP
ncbi:hypothetical protein [Geodermatophilus saharensis]|uniref:hypothetical protein n=1 Tax=Geodermatophilus saharensis TaxID=1137994 RepID=UPI000B792E49|nr:hypothetical protein [Geodermatophilus saharensis]